MHGVSVPDVSLDVSKVHSPRFGALVEIMVRGDSGVVSYYIYPSDALALEEAPINVGMRIETDEYPKYPTAVYETEDSAFCTIVIGNVAVMGGSNDYFSPAPAGAAILLAIGGVAHLERVMASLSVGSAGEESGEVQRSGSEDGASRSEGGMAQIQPTVPSEVAPLPVDSPEEMSPESAPSPSSRASPGAVAATINGDLRNGSCDSIGWAVSARQVAGIDPIQRIAEATACTEYAGGHLILLGACVEPNPNHDYAEPKAAIVACELRLWSEGVPSIGVSAEDFALIDNAGSAAAGDPRSFCHDARAEIAAILPTGSYLRCFIDFPSRRGLGLPFLVEYRPALGVVSTPPPVLRLVVNVVEPLPPMATDPSDQPAPQSAQKQDPECRIVRAGDAEVRIGCDEDENP